MDILFEDNISIAPIIYEAMEEQQQIMIEMASMLYNFQKTDNIEIVQEGFMDVLEKIKEAVMRLIEKVRKTIKDFLEKLNSRSASFENAAKKYGEHAGSHSIKPITLTGYNFTVSENTRPNVNVIEKIYYEYNAGLLNFNKLSSSQVKKLCEDINSSTTLDKKRGELLGVNKPLSLEELRKEAFAYYRDGKSEAFDIKITDDDVRSISKNASKLSSERHHTYEEQRVFEKLLHSMEKEFKTTIPNAVKSNPSFMKASVTFIGGRDGKASDENTKTEFKVWEQGDIANLSDFNNYVNARYKQTVAIATAVTSVFSHRISAIESKMRQDEYVLREAAKQSGHSLEESMRVFDRCNSYPMTVDRNWACVTEGCNLIGGEIYG